jgi:PST family polysaccharide transporter
MKKYFAFERIFRSLQALLTSVVAARLLSTELFSDYLVVLIVLSFLTPLALFGIESNVIKRMTCNANKWLLHSAILILFTSLISLSIFLLIILWLEIDKAYITLSLVFCSFPIYTLNYFNQAKQDFHFNFIAYFLSFVIGGLYKVFLLMNSIDSMLYIIIMIAVDATLPAFFQLGIWGWTKKYHVKFKLKFAANSKNVFELLSASLPLVLSSFIAISFMKVDQIMVRFLSSDQEMVTLGVASKLNEGLLIFPSIIIGMFYPNLLRAFKLGRSYLNMEIRLLLKKAMILMTFIYLVVYFLSDFLVSFIYGPQFIESATVLKIQALTLFVTFYGMLATRVCVIYNLQKYVLMSNVIGLILNVFINSLVIPSYGALGAACATCLTQLCTSFCFWKLNSNTKKYFEFKVHD